MSALAGLFLPPETRTRKRARALVRPRGQRARDSRIPQPPPPSRGGCASAQRLPGRWDPTAGAARQPRSGPRKAGVQPGLHVWMTSGRTTFREQPARHPARRSAGSKESGKELLQSPERHGPTRPDGGPPSWASPKINSVRRLTPPYRPNPLGTVS